MDEIERAFPEAMGCVSGLRLHEASLVFELRDAAEPLVFVPVDEG